MKILISGLFFCTTVACAQPYPLSALIRYAIDNNPQMHEAEARIDQSQAQIKQFHAAFLPQLNVGSSYTKTTLPMLAFGDIINQRAYRSGIDFNRPGTLDNWNLYTNIRYNLYRGGSDRALLNMAKHHQNATTSERETLQQRLIYEVICAYYNIRQAQDMLRVTESAVLAAKEHVRIAKSKEEAGTLLQEDTLKTEVHLAQMEEELIKCTHTLALAYTTLAHLLGIKKGDIEIGDDDLNWEYPDDKICTRSELESVTQQIRALESKIDSIRGNRKPTVDAFFDGIHDRGWHTHSQGTHWNAGISLNWLIFDGQQNFSKLLEAQAELRTLNAHKHAIELTLDLETQRAGLGLQEAKTRIKVTQKMLELAEKMASLTRHRYTHGTALTSDLIESEHMLIDAHTRYASAQNYQIVAIITLRRALGKSLVNFYD